jgi:hypothetical protein
VWGDRMGGRLDIGARGDYHEPKSLAPESHSHRDLWQG